MEAIRKQVGFEGGLHAFFDFLRTDPQFYYETADELLAGYRDICKRADPELTKLFRKLLLQELFSSTRFSLNFQEFNSHSFLYLCLLCF